MSDGGTGVRRAWIIGASVWAVAALVVGTLQMAGSLAHHEYTVERRFDTEGISVLEVDVADGDVSVIGVDADELRVRARVSDGLMATDATQRRVGDRVVLTAGCPWLSQFCSTDYEVLVPRDLTVRIDVGDGRVELTGVRGPVQVDGRDGDVELRDVSGPVRVSTSDGSVTGTGLAGATAEASTRDGRVALAFAAPPRDVAVSTSDGDATVVVPAGDTAYVVDADTVGGRIMTAVRIDPTADRRISARTRDGDVTVRYP